MNLGKAFAAYVDRTALAARYKAIIAIFIEIGQTRTPDGIFRTTLHIVVQGPVSITSCLV